MTGRLAPRCGSAILGIVCSRCSPPCSPALCYLQVLPRPTSRSQAEPQPRPRPSRAGPPGPHPRPPGPGAGRQPVVQRRHRRPRRARRSTSDPGRARPARGRARASHARSSRRALADRRLQPVQPVPVAEDVPERGGRAPRGAPRRLPGGRASRTGRAHVPLRHPGRPRARLRRARSPTRARGRAGRGLPPGRPHRQGRRRAAVRGRPAGHAGQARLEVDASGRVLRELARQAARARATTCSSRSTSTCSGWPRRRSPQGLEAARSAQPRRGRRRTLVAPAGAVVVLDPSDGAVLAMASYPTYDPPGVRQRHLPEDYAALTAPTRPPRSSTGPSRASTPPAPPSSWSPPWPRCGPA